MEKLTEPKECLYFKIIHNLDIWLTSYPRRCLLVLRTAAVTYPSLESERDKPLSSIFQRFL